MSLSKPSELVFTVLGSYYNALYNHPVRTKALTSCAVAVLGNLTSQFVARTKTIDQDSLVAYGIYGILFGGTVPHYFYLLLDHLVPYSSPRYQIKQLLIERFIFTPLYQLFALYMLARLEGKSHGQTVRQILSLYWPVLRANWRLLTLAQAANLAYVPPMLRVLANNLIGFVWTIFLAHKRRLSDSSRKA